MKTAMQDLIKYIDKLESKTTDQEQIYMLAALNISALLLLKKEKEQITEAHKSGGYEMFTRTSKEYYNQTYNQNK